MGGFGRKKGKGEMLKLYHKLKKNKNEHGQTKTRLHFRSISVHNINS